MANNIHFTQEPAEQNQTMNLSENQMTEDQTEQGQGGQPFRPPQDGPLHMWPEEQDAENAQSGTQAPSGSFAALLQNNLGNYVVIEFLIDNTGLVEKEGLLYAVGKDFITLYEAETDRYIVGDLGAIKFVTFYNQTSRARSRAAVHYGRGGSFPGTQGRRAY